MKIMTKQLYWLAGIIDGEGSIIIEKYKSNGRIYYYPKITISNTSKLIINYIKKILKQLNITYYCIKNKSQRNDGYIRIPCYDLQIHRMNEILILANILKDKLILKKVKIKLLIKYCKLRINKRKKV